MESRSVGLAEHAAQMGQRRNAHKIFKGNIARKGALRETSA
jgi:hypothetical protein